MGKALIAALLLLAAAAYGQPRQTPLSKLPSDYSLEQAKADGCVVYEDLDVTQGQEQFAGFAERAAKHARYVLPIITPWVTRPIMPPASMRRSRMNTPCCTCRTCPLTGSVIPSVG